MFSLASVCLFVSGILRKNYSTDFKKNRWKGGVHGPRKKQLDFGGILRVRVGLRLHGAERYRIGFTSVLFNSNSCAASAALAEVCALLSAVIVITVIITILSPSSLDSTARCL